ncbi:hypothetical protein [Paenarthrobacter aurescens]|uniref:hypothetical protein n=1 Tax=Paenarthrobacter aurescens TaxID=43663 RepID=UPI0035EB7473
MAIDETALQRLLDKEAIREASLKYTRGIDRHDDDILRQVYHPDARDDHGEYIGSAEGLIHTPKRSTAKIGGCIIISLPT